MKKKLFIITSLSIIALAAIFTFSNTTSSIDKLFMENIAALADDPISWIDDGGAIPIDKCQLAGVNIASGGVYHCMAGTSSSTQYPCNGSVKYQSLATTRTCYLPH